MTQPQEIEVWFLLPAIRKELSISLKKMGLKQKEIAEKLGVTSSAISQYLKEKRASNIVLSNQIKSELKLSAEKIVNNNANIIEEIQKACFIAKKDRTLCNIHKSQGFDITNCDICMKS